MIKYFTKIILYFFDRVSQKKLLTLLKKKFNKNIGYVIDVGAHNGETINFLRKNFKFKIIFAFEPNFDSYQILKNRFSVAEKNIILINKGVGQKNEKKILTNLGDSASSSYCSVNKKSRYFKKKNFFLTLNKLEKHKTQILTLSSFLKKNKIKKIDYLKTDTEGYELNVIKGLKEHIKNIKVIQFEHHYNDMLKKDYTFYDIHSYLLRKGFQKIFKIKMPFRKSFEYVYENIKF